MLTAILIFLIINFILLVFLGLNFVRFKEKIYGIITDYLNFEEEDIPENLEIPAIPKREAKTWDEKYEQELEAYYNRMRANSGLKDPDANWGTSEKDSPDFDDRLKSDK